MRADRAFRDLVVAAVGAVATITVPLAITLFPGDLQRALHGYDALAETCALALYRLGSALPPLGAIVLALTCALFLAGGAQASRTLWRTHRAIRSRKRVPSPPQLVRAAAHAGVASATVCFDDLRPIAYCAGLFRPRVWVSRGAVRTLERRELEAVLLHEAYHLRRRDPWRILVAQILHRMLFPFPLVDSLVSRFEVARERGSRTRSRAPARTLTSDPHRRAERGMPRVTSIEIVPSKRLPRAFTGRLDRPTGRPEEWFLGTLQTTVLEALGKRGASTVREITEALRGKFAYTTVMTVLGRLHQKGLVGRELRGKGYVYTPRYSAAELRERMAKYLVDEMVEDFGDVALAHFAGVLDRVDRARLLRLRRGLAARK